jgi:hypothetical protein
MNTTTSELLKTLSDAITASGKKLSEIGKESIFEYLKRSEVQKNLWEGLYEKLKNLHEPGNHGTSGPGTADYLYGNSTTSLTQEKHREPRKKVFGEVKKIAG